MPQFAILYNIYVDGKWNNGCTSGKIPVKKSSFPVPPGRDGGDASGVVHTRVEIVQRTYDIER
jgi:hypothetical protein